MVEALKPLLLWIEHNAWLLAGVSLASLLLSLLLLPWYVARIPEDYFSHPQRHRMVRQSRHPLLDGILVVLKNLLGALLVLAGVIMLFTPGQGLLTLLVGLMLMNFPGKYRLECWLVSRPGIWKSLNWLRRRSGRPQLLPVRKPQRD